MPKKILLLGAAGSIGTQSLDVIARHPKLFELTAVSTGHNRKKLEEIIRQFPSVQMAGLSSAQDGTICNVPLLGSEDQMSRLVDEADYDILINAVVGFRGLEPTLRAIARGKDVALANKETMVCGGALVKEALKKNPVQITPIDSEHSAIFQCLQSSRHGDIANLLITASGGSLRDLKRDQLEDITPERALAHPSWKMGPRITIDSATMVNKAFEVIEAHYLFDIPYDLIETILHPQSLVHSMVRFQDNAILAQLGSADMRIPIQYALTVPDRPVLTEEKPLDFHEALSLDFKPMDHERYPILKTIVNAVQKEGNRGTIVNAADEQAVALFLQGKIPFLQIEDMIVRSLEHFEQEHNPSLERLTQLDQEVREFVRKQAE